LAGTKSTSHKHKKGKNSRDGLPKEFRKIKPPTFDGGVKSSEEVEAWIVGLKKHFQLHDYSRNTKARVIIFNMNGRDFIFQWEDLKNVKRIIEKKVTWRKLKGGILL
jgi:hypothetical protein